MYMYTISNMQQLEAFSVSSGDMFPVQVLERLKEQIKALDDNYGSGRNLDADLGGYAVLFSGFSPAERTERRNLLEKYHASEEEYEYREEIMHKGRCIWIEELYILSSDYSVIFFYPILSEEGERQYD